MMEENRSKMQEPVVPRLVPLPDWCRGMEEPVICLDGDWEIIDQKDGKAWEVKVPFDTTILHRKGLSNRYEYRREIALPAIENDSRVVLKFEGVNGFADVCVDGVHVASHKNAFLTWNVEITEQVRGRKSVELRVAVDEESDTVSCFNHGGILHSVWLYLLPEVYVNALYLTPLFDEDMVTCTLRADLDIAGWCNGVMRGEKNSARERGPVQEGMTARSCRYTPDGEPEAAEGLAVQFKVYAPDGKLNICLRTALENRVNGYYTVNLPIEDPVLWDAEHPYLYRVEAELYSGAEKLETVSRRTGLRRLERRKNLLYVNGRQVKLRGACRHEISPRSGRALSRELIARDVALFKEANCNYIRTSHYPPSEYFLEQCDEKGIYVEDELALAFVAKTTPYTQRDPEETERYYSHFTETLARDYNHPSVIIWSLSNESFGGYNFDLLNRYVHRKDPTRMTKFSYPMTIQEEHEMPDIWSIHYSEYDTDLGKKRDNVSVGHAPGRDMPVLHDEYVHVCCYNREELRRDPSVRTFWGEGIRIFWDNIWNTEGALGGAIWAGIDETDIYDGGNTQLEWGIIDVWRRKKPEFYMVRKGYSPIKILHSELKAEEKKALLVLENRFCHTDLSQVEIRWKYGERRGSSYLPAAVPGKAIKVVISLEEAVQEEAPAGKTDREDLFPEEAALGEALWLQFLDAVGNCVDETLVTEREYGKEESPLAGENLTEAYPARMPSADTSGHWAAILEQPGETVVEGSTFRFVFSRENGLLKGLWLKGNTSAEARDGTEQGKETEQLLLTGGPLLNVPYLKLGKWELSSFEAKQTDSGVQVKIRGGYRDTLSMEWRILIEENGSFATEYVIEQVFRELPRQIKLRVGVDDGGLDELGVSYLAAPGMDMLSWKRKRIPDGEWGYSWYPEDHISRNHGTARRFSEGNIWGEEPRVSWSLDMRDDILYGRYEAQYGGTNDFRSTKEDVEEARLYSEEKGIGIKVMGDAACPAHIRAEVADPEEWKILDTDGRIRYTGTWYPVEDKKESDHGTEMWSREKGACAECTFTGTGIVWYGPQDTTYGMANVYIDGKLAAEKVNQRVAGVDFPCSSAGFDKKYHLPIFSADGLPYGEHTIRIEVCGEKAADSSDYYIVIDYLRVLTGERTEPVKLHINQAFAYPHISWGNYRRPPILIESGTRGRVRMQGLMTADSMVQR